MDKIDIKLFEKFKEIARKLKEIQKEVIAKFNLSWGYYKILSSLLAKENLTQTKLSDICDIDKPATSRLVNKMTEEGFITKQYKNENKKNIYLSLTSLGKKIAVEIKSCIMKVQEKYFKKLNTNEKQTLLALLD